MSKNQKLKRIEEEDLPILYRLLIKIPLKSLGSSSGIFWALVCPILVFLNFFFDFFILVYFSFPINIILALAVPAVVFILFVRVILERFINWWNNFVVSGYVKRDLEKVLDEYITLIGRNEESEKSA